MQRKRTGVRRATGAPMQANLCRFVTRVLKWQPHTWRSMTPISHCAHQTAREQRV